MDQNQINQLGGAIAGMMGIIMLFGLAFTIFIIFVFWRILNKAGLAGPLALLTIIPVVGPIIVPCILAFSEWRVVPAPNPYAGLQPYPPPPPPTSFNPPPPQS